MKTNVFPATVTNVDDPQQIGRVKVKCPGLVRSDRELPYWVAPTFPYVGAKACGWFFPPDVGDQVEIEVSEASKSDEIPGETSISAPNARYRAYLYNDSQQLPDEFKENYPKRRGVKTPSGHIFLFDDTEGGERVMLADKFGNTALFTTNGLKVFDQNGYYIELKSSGIELEAPAIKVGAAASEHLVKGESLLNWITASLKVTFDTHTHPHPMGPTGTPLVPLPTPPASVLSTKHTVE